MILPLSRMWVGRQPPRWQELQMSRPAIERKISATLLARLVQLSVTLVSLLMLVRDWIRRAGPRVQIAKSAITRDHVRNAFLHSAVLAVPVHVSFEVYYCAPRGVTISSTG